MKFSKTSLMSMVLTGALSTFSALSAVAAPAASDFKSYDANADGLISQREYADRGGFKQAFQEGDANLDYHLSPDEFSKANAVNDRIRTGKYADDSWITAKVKTLLLQDETVKGLDVSVETYKGTVQLSGWVNNATQLALAEKLAYSVAGVKEIKNDLQIKQ